MSKFSGAFSARIINWRQPLKSLSLKLARLLIGFWSAQTWPDPYFQLLNPHPTLPPHPGTSSLAWTWDYTKLPYYCCIAWLWWRSYSGSLIRQYGLLAKSCSRIFVTRLQFLEGEEYWTSAAPRSNILSPSKNFSLVTNIRLQLLANKPYIATSTWLW